MLASSTAIWLGYRAASWGKSCPDSPVVSSSPVPSRAVHVGNGAAQGCGGSIHDATVPVDGETMTRAIN